jgi:hypothetical protein
MIENLIKSMMPSDFDMNAVIAGMQNKAQEISATRGMVESLVLAMSDQEQRLDLMTKQLEAVIYRIEPDARPVDGWLVENGKNGDKHFSAVDPREMITREDIAENELSISPVFKL